MSEGLPQSKAELESTLAVDRLIRDYFPEDIGFILEELADQEDLLGFLYGQLLEAGEDPDEVLERYGITEATIEVFSFDALKNLKTDDGTELAQGDQS